MVVTDGAPEDYAKVFEKYNWNQTNNADDSTQNKNSDRVPSSKWVSKSSNTPWNSDYCLVISGTHKLFAY